jgi:hypothetical protein
MSTSGGGTLNVVLYLVALVPALQAGALLSGRRWAAPTPAAGLLWLLIAATSVLQIPFPELLRGLRRDPELIRRHGQYWRLLTSVAVQDGGVSGTVINLIALAIVLIFAGRLWRPAGLVLVLLLSQLTFDLLAVFLSSDVGAGNSGATLGLATSMIGAGLWGPARPGIAIRALVVAAAGVLLLAIGDLHGSAVLAGMPIGMLVAASGRREP